MNLRRWIPWMGVAVAAVILALFLARLIEPTRAVDYFGTLDPEEAHTLLRELLKQGAAERQIVLFKKLHFRVRGHKVSSLGRKILVLKGAGSTAVLEVAPGRIGRGVFLRPGGQHEHFEVSSPQLQGRWTAHVSLAGALGSDEFFITASRLDGGVLIRRKSDGSVTTEQLNEPLCPSSGVAYQDGGLLLPVCRKDEAALLRYEVNENLRAQELSSSLGDITDIATFRGDVFAAGRERSDGSSVIERRIGPNNKSTETLGEREILDLWGGESALFAAGTSTSEGKAVGLVGRFDGGSWQFAEVAGSRLVFEVAGNSQGLACLADLRDGKTGLLIAQLALGQELETGRLRQLLPSMTKNTAALAATGDNLYAIGRDLVTGFTIVQRISLVDGSLGHAIVLLPNPEELVNELGIEATSSFEVRSLAFLIFLVCSLGALGLLLVMAGPRLGRWREIREPLFSGVHRDDPLLGAAAKGEWEKIYLMWRALLLLGIALALGTLGVWLFVEMLGDLEVESSAPMAGETYGYLRAAGILVSCQLVALYLIKQFGRTLREYRVVYREFLRRVDIVVAARLLSEGFGVNPSPAQREFLRALHSSSPPEGESTDDDDELDSSLLAGALRELIGRHEGPK